MAGEEARFSGWLCAGDQPCLSVPIWPWPSVTSRPFLISSFLDIVCSDITLLSYIFLSLSRSSSLLSFPLHWNNLMLPPSLSIYPPWGLGGYCPLSWLQSVSFYFGLSVCPPSHCLPLSHIHIIHMMFLLLLPHFSNFENN